MNGRMDGYVNGRVEWIWLSGWMQDGLVHGG